MALRVAMWNESLKKKKKKKGVSWNTVPSYYSKLSKQLLAAEVLGKELKV